MDARDRIRVAEAAEMAARPGRTPAQVRARWHRLVEIGVIPRAVETDWGRGGLTFIYPDWAAAVACVIFDLIDAGAVSDRAQLRGMWSYLAEPHHEGGEPLIVHVLAEVEAGNPCFLVLTLWRNQDTGEITPTCGVRFSEELERPFEAPSQFHEPVVKCVTPLHLLLARFADAEPNQVN